MKILKMIIISIVVLAAIVLGIAYYSSGKIDAYVKTAIEKYGSESLGTKVSVGEVNISLRQTTATITNLEIANPPGFDDPIAFKAGLIEIALNSKESKLDSVVIDRILLNSPMVFYIKTKQTDNLSVLQDNVARSTKEQQSSKKAGDPKGKTDKDRQQPRILIKKFDIEGANLSYRDTRIVSTTVNLKLDDIHITDIDTGKNGAGTQEAVSKIVNAIVPAVKQAAIKSVAAYLDVATDTLRNVSDSAQQLGKEAVTNIKKFFQKQ
jgi:hypothetical protein